MITCGFHLHKDAPSELWLWIDTTKFAEKVVLNQRYIKLCITFVILNLPPINLRCKLNRSINNSTTRQTIINGQANVYENTKPFRIHSRYPVSTKSGVVVSRPSGASSVVERGLLRYLFILLLSLTAEWEGRRAV